MAFSDKWTRIQLLASCRRTLADPQARFWSDEELINYIDEWQQSLQDTYEFVWGTASTTTTASTFALATLASDAMRIDAVYWNGTRLTGKSKVELDQFAREWRNSTAGSQPPQVVYMDDSQSFTLWPAPGTATMGTLIVEYPLNLSFASATSTMQIPAWTRYSCKDYVAYKSYLREGPANNVNKALRYKRRYERAVKRFRTMWDNYFPTRAPRLKPGTGYEQNIQLTRAGGVGSPPPWGSNV